LAKTLDPLQAFLKRQLSKPSRLQTLAFWATAFTAGMVCVSYAGIFKKAEGFYRSIAETHPDAVWVLTPLGLLGAWALIAFLSPEAGGSGIPQVLAANDLDYKKNGPWVDRLLSAKMVLVKIASSLVAALGGCVTGREGPTIQVSTGIFHIVGRVFRRFFPNTDSSSWIVAGAAAGLASAFNTPLGGIVFAIEEMSVHFKRFKTSLFIAIIVAGLVSQWLLGSYLYLGYPDLGTVSFSILPLALFTGIATGLAGALYGKTLKRLLTWRKDLVDKKSMALLALLCGTALASFAFLNREASGSGLEVINAILFKGVKAGWELSVLRILGSLLFYISGAAGGIFAPSLAAGACLASWIADLSGTASANLLVLSGMAGFLTGVTRTPFTAFVLVLEMTDHHGVIFPLMLASIAADLAAKRLDPDSFYEWSRGLYMPDEKTKIHHRGTGTQSGKGKAKRTPKRLQPN
jgi:H+/Cl- antiporter ClcA